jgi:hypothetical protein
VTIIGRKFYEECRTDGEGESPIQFAELPAGSRRADPEKEKLRIMTILPKITAGATVALAAAVLAAAHSPVSAAMKHIPTKHAAMSSAVSQGKMLVSTYRCNGCHGADLAGKPGFTPSLHRSGVLKEYSLHTFTRVLLTGVTAGGGHVKPPMPVYGMAMPPMGGPHHGGMPPPPGGMPPGGMHGMPPPPGGMGGMHHGRRHGPPPPPMKASQAVAIYTYLRTLP